VAGDVRLWGLRELPAWLTFFFGCYEASPNKGQGRRQACPRLALRKGASSMKKTRLFFAAAALLFLSSVLVGATAGHAGVRKRLGVIAFLRTVGDGPSGVFVIRPDGSGLRRLTPSRSDIGSYEWGPDGSRIAYLDRQGALWLVRPDGTGRRLLAASSPRRDPWDLSWSPDGEEIAVLASDPEALPAPTNSDPHFRIVVVPTDGGAVRRLPSGDAQVIDWSPQGDEIVYGDGTGRQRIIRTDGSKPRPFFHPLPKYGHGLPRWSPDGTHVGFVGFGGEVQRGRYTDRYAGIYVADADGRNLHLVTSHAYNEYGFAWSPDGRWILYGRANRAGIYVIGADGRNNHRLTSDSPKGSLFPVLTWSPDGRSVAYETDRTGNGDIYLIDADGHNHVQLTSSPAGDIEPSWQPR
jgi:TolB protein